MKTALAAQTPWQGLGGPQRSPDCRWGGERAGTGAGLPLRVRRGSQPALASVCSGVGGRACDTRTHLAGLRRSGERLNVARRS